MPVKILLADKSITIQKVVEMLFSGKEFEVTCVSDGESALAEVARIPPNVVLADVDLPRIDGYSFAMRLKQEPRMARIPVILMLSRDDVYDDNKGVQAGIVDNIAKPFESQELIGKVKKALAAVLAQPVEQPKPVPPAPAARVPAVPESRPTAPPPPAAAAPTMPARPVVPAVPPPQPAPAVFSPAPAAAVPQPPVQPALPTRPRAAVPTDIFDIIQEAPTQAEVRREPAQPQQQADETSLFEVEPEMEIEAEVMPEAAPVTAEAHEVPAPRVVEEVIREAVIAPAVQPAEESPLLEAENPPEPAMPEFSDDELVSVEVEPDGDQEAPPTGDLSEEELLFGMAEEVPAARASEAEQALPFGEKAVEEMREGLGLAEERPATEALPDFKIEEQAPAPMFAEPVFAEPLPSRAGQAWVPPAADLSATEESSAHPDIVNFESLDMASRTTQSFTPAPAAAERIVVPDAVPASASSSSPDAADDAVRIAAREAVERIVREVVERVAWEVIPELAEHLIRAEIERLKSEP